MIELAAVLCLIIACRRLDPRTLAEIVAAAIEERVDRAIYEETLEAEEKARQDVLSRLQR